MADEVPRSAARADIRMLFSTLNRYYGAYIYLGGDDVFLPIRDSLMDIVDTQAVWDTNCLAVLIHEALSSVINDRHMHLNRIGFTGINYGFFSYSGRFAIETEGFKCQATGRYVAELILPCNPDYILEIADIFRLSMDEGGEYFFYTPILALRLQAEQLAPCYLLIMYKCGTTETVALEAYAMPMFAQLGSLAYHVSYEPHEIIPFEPFTSLELIQGFPVVSVNKMGTPDAPDGENASGVAMQFLEYARVLRDEPIIIIDLRGNVGGNGILPTQWLYYLLDEIVPHNFVKLTPMDYYAYREFTGIDAMLPTEVEVSIFSTISPLDDNHTISGFPTGSLVENNQLIILLIDRLVGSAGEAMVDLAFSIENTFVIGQNTHGALICVGDARRTMPGSGIPFGFGVSLFVHPEGHFTESRGFAPDIWVSGDALEAAIGMLSNHLSHLPSG